MPLTAGFSASTSSRSWPFAERVEAAPYSALQAHCGALTFGSPWTDEVCDRANQLLAECAHGDFPAWRTALDRLPRVATGAAPGRAAPRFGAEVDDRDGLAQLLMALHPWRKGPLEIGGVAIDTEWRSDRKWARIAPHVDLEDHAVLDIGCGNGYFGWRMLADGARLVIGIDPTWVYVMQWLACRHFAGDLPNFVLPLGVEHLPETPVAFDTVCSMGVLYHRRDHARHLGRLRSLLRPGGTLVLETLVLPGDRADDLLVPEGRYARMRNVWAIPGTERLLAWVHAAGFGRAAIVDVGRTDADEQRSTPWMTFESLEKALDTKDPSRTVEGHPAPRRAVVIARVA